MMITQTSLNTAVILIQRWGTTIAIINLNFQVTIIRSQTKGIRGKLQLPNHKNIRFYTQYYNGYGESLIDYQQRIQRIGIGISLNNVFQFSPLKDNKSAVDFHEIPLKQTALDMLHAVFGYQSFRKGQEEVIDATLMGKRQPSDYGDGNGKSLCYQIPALCFEGLTLVISPLISLMKDQVDQLLANGIEADYLNSSQTFTEQQQVQNKLMSGTLKLLYVSPEK